MISSTVCPFSFLQYLLSMYNQQLLKEFSIWLQAQSLKMDRCRETGTFITTPVSTGIVTCMKGMEKMSETALNITQYSKLVINMTMKLNL